MTIEAQMHELLEDIAPNAHNEEEQAKSLHKPLLFLIRHFQIEDLRKKLTKE